MFSVLSCPPSGGALAEGFKERLKEFQCFERRFEVCASVNLTPVCILFLILFIQTPPPKSKELNFQETKLICCFRLISAGTSQPESGLDSNCSIGCCSQLESHLWGKRFSFVQTRKHKQIINQSFIKLCHIDTQSFESVLSSKYTEYFFSCLVKECHYRCRLANKTQLKLQKQQRPLVTLFKTT